MPAALDGVQMSEYNTMFNTHLRRCVMNQVLPVAADTLEFMLTQGIPPETSELQHLIHKLGKQNSWSRARTLFKRESVCADVFFFFLLILWQLVFLTSALYTNTTWCCFHAETVFLLPVRCSFCRLLLRGCVWEGLLVPALLSLRDWDDSGIWDVHCLHLYKPSQFQWCFPTTAYHTQTVNAQTACCSSHLNKSHGPGCLMPLAMVTLVILAPVRFIVLCLVSGSYKNCGIRKHEEKEGLQYLYNHSEEMIGVSSHLFYAIQIVNCILFLITNIEE